MPIFGVDAPPDVFVEAVYEKTLKFLEPFGLIISAGGGVASLAVPHLQRLAGIRSRVLEMAMLRECKPGDMATVGPQGTREMGAGLAEDLRAMAVAPKLLAALRAVTEANAFDSMGPGTKLLVADALKLVEEPS